MIRAAFRVGALAVLLVAAARTQAQGALPAGVRGPVDAGNGVMRYDRASAAAYPAYWWQRLFELFEWKPAAKAPFRRSVAFLAGVSTYENRGLRALQWVPTDLDRLRNFLLSEGGFDTVLELREGAVTRSTIEDYMATRFASASELLGPEDRLLFYYSGHGGDQQGRIGYLQFRKAVPGSFSGESVLPVRDFQQWATVNVAKHFLVVLDACASGLAVTAKAPPSPQALVASLSGEGSGFLLTAGTGAQSVYQYQINERQGHSVLTNALLEALRSGADRESPGFLTIHQVFGRAEVEVKRFEAQQGKRMDPQLWELERGDGLRKGTFVFLGKSGQKPVLPDRYSGVIATSKTLGEPAVSEINPPNPAGGSYQRSQANLVVRSESRAAGSRRIVWRDGLTYVWVPPASFTMGCDHCGGHSDQRPARTVRLTKGFWISTTEVTQEAYFSVTGQSPSFYKGPKRPVEQVSWGEAKSYCATVGLRLPTEAEWEYAARAGTAGSQYGEIDRISWHFQNSGTVTHEVAQKDPNIWGLFDMLGNVSEWVEDWYDARYYTEPGTTVDPTGPSQGEVKVLRGQSCKVAPNYVTATYRHKHSKDQRVSSFGFRCAGNGIDLYSPRVPQ